VLASASPRRRELLAAVGVQPIVRPPDVDESSLPDERPLDLVRRLAVDKTRTDCRPGELRLAADTVVIHQGEAFGKPLDDEDAARMLRRLSGETHQVASGVALFDVDHDRFESVVVTTDVVFAGLSEDEIATYIQSTEARGKAGAYAIQGRAALFITEIRGSYSNVVGLPLAQTYLLFSRLGFDLRSFGS
jgi:septum formation protein